MSDTGEPPTVLARGTAKAAIGQRIRAYRERKGLSQTDLGALMDPPMGQGTVVKLESGRRPLDVDELAMIARALDTPRASLWLEFDRSSELEAEIQEAATALLWATRQVGSVEANVRRLRNELEEAEAELTDAIRERQNHAEELEIARRRYETTEVD